MVDRDARLRLDLIYEQVLGLRGLVMAQIAAVDRILPGSAAATAQGAETMRRAAIHRGEQGLASAIEMLLDELRDRHELPAND